MSDKPPRDGRTCFYAVILPAAIAAAREAGYAIALHGSMADDLDLIAVPWVDDARSDVDLVESIMKAVGAFVPGGIMPGFDKDAKPAIEKNRKTMPHGRLSFNINWMGHVRIDLAVMPRVIEPAQEAA